ncbi:membrane protein [Reticulibacter mediterranei]|uniref:Membrane protein n=1 Tax=Reticulibacter mediterranei TaxID=2778369 RepID=A0A8J3N637_9CHLR|nr:membrane protein insertase YidC [Reticulibacter mediterranei]GHO97015.1 membrane protein [Reticulibacter mediterranei]
MNALIQLFHLIFTYPILNVLMELYHLFHDFGFAIVLLTVIVYLLNLPFTLQRVKLARQQRTLQPQLDEVDRQHNDLLARMAARQEFLQQHGISATSSIGPVLFQMLILSGLFLALNMVISNATLDTINGIMYPFLAHFSQLPDLNLNWFTFLNAALHIALNRADPTHILPILTGIITFIQMRMAQPLTETKEAVVQSTQLLQLVGPLIGVGITMFFVWQFAAGVALYRLVYLVVTAVQQYFMTGWGSLWSVPAFAGIFASTSGHVGRETSKSRRARKSARRHGKRFRKRL